MNDIVAVKNYGFEWYMRYGLSEAEAARTMDDMGSTGWRCRTYGTHSRRPP